MPIYEFRCGECGRVSSFFVRSINTTLEPVCQHCQSGAMQRVMSSFAMGKTVHGVHAQHSYSGESPIDYYSDPRNIGRHVEESFKKYGMEMPSSVRDNIDAAREGHLPKGAD